MPHVPATEITLSDKPTTSGTSKRPAILLFVFRAPREFDSTKIQSPKLERLHFYLSHIKNLWGNFFE